MAVITPFDPWKSPLCTCPSKYSFSAYTGCAHACRYCYISAYIPHAFQCRAKEDITKRLRRDLRRVNPKLHISIANSSDPYTPPEDSLQLTRKALQILLSGGFKVQLITKSDLIIRDLDLIRKGNCSVSMSITTLDNDIARKLEPNAPPPSKRLKAVSKLVKEGVPCSMRIDPVIPEINDMGFQKLVEAIANTGASHIVASTYKAKTDSFKRLTSAFPEHRKKLTEHYWTEGRSIQRARYLPEKMRREILTHLKSIVEEFNMTYATCREGMTDLQSGEKCDGSHLIPIGFENFKTDNRRERPS